MPNLNQEAVQVVQQALMFMAEKYRQIQLRSNMFADSVITERAMQVEARARNLMHGLAMASELGQADADLVKGALDAHIKDLNRSAVLASDRGQHHEAESLRARIMPAYAVRDQIETIAAGGTVDPTIREDIYRAQRPVTLDEGEDI